MVDSARRAGWRLQGPAESGLNEINLKPSVGLACGVVCCGFRALKRCKEARIAGTAYRPLLGVVLVGRAGDEST